jgi:hypothetical protein
MSDNCENHSLAANGAKAFYIASVDRQSYNARENAAARKTLEDFATLQDVPFRRVLGCYKMQSGPNAGKVASEVSYVISADHWQVLFEAGCFKGQESVLALGPRTDRDGYRPATLVFLDTESEHVALSTKELPVALGYFVPCSIERAKREDNYTIDEAAELGYVATWDASELEE